MEKTTALDPVSVPLNSRVLIEASAGTGKTYTIASLYLRLLLQAGQPAAHNFARPLRVEQILVVTFTEAATQELKARIRERIQRAKALLNIYRRQGDKAIFRNTDNAMLETLVDELDIGLAVERLNIAERNMDMAAIYTIHGFCRRMLMQYAFHSGIHFDLELVADESELIERFCAEFWRENFYPQPLQIARFIHRHFISPQQVMAEIRPYVYGDMLKIETQHGSLLNLSLQEFFEGYLLRGQQALDQLKAAWLAQAEDIERLILEEIGRDYKKGEKKRLKRRVFNSSNPPKWLREMKDWAQNSYETALPEKGIKYFSQQALIDYAEEGAEPIYHPLFEQLDNVRESLADTELYRKLILAHYIRGVRAKLLDYKLKHKEKSFEDLLHLFKQALYARSGDELADAVRHRYPFAMIDEFQDTDNNQYQIFHKLYMGAPTNAEIPTGFLMIGDPKQAIYRFRGADIFTYLKASRQAALRLTLGLNYRSHQDLLKAVNGLFDFSLHAPFLYKGIGFEPVGNGKKLSPFMDNGQKAAAFDFYLGDETQAARCCAQSIARWLKDAAQNNTGFGGEQELVPLQPKDIAVLVRNRYEAAEIRKALLAYDIPSVYLSDDSNVFDAGEAKDLLLILNACLNPLNERNILNAIATSTFSLTAQDIHHIKHSEKDWEQWVERFLHYQRIWRYQGVLAMLHRLFMREAIVQRLIGSAEGERRVTDLFHLAELLQQAAATNENEAALVHWLEAQIQGENRTDAQRIRLESERQLVRVVTVHKSKGLEYPLVWLPFIAKGVKTPSRRDISTYYDKAREAIHWDMDNQHQEQRDKESLAEEMRLLYVALTRAKYHISFVLPTQFEKQWNALLYALTQGEIGETRGLDGTYQSRPLLEALGRRIGEQNLRIMAFDGEEEIAALTEEIRPPLLEGEYFNLNIERDWRVLGFTALARMHEQKSSGMLASSEPLSGVDFYAFSEQGEYAGEERNNFSLAADNMSPEGQQESRFQDYPPGFSPVDFPHGIYVGNALHRYFEKYAFGPVAEEGIQSLCHTLQLAQEWQAPLAQWLENIRSHPLAEVGIALKDLAPSDYLQEMQFYLKLSRNLKIGEFNRLLQQYHPLYCRDWQLEEIKGMIRGFMDLVFRHGGKYYIADYKSNLLGMSPQHYGKDVLQQGMQNNQYDLQYLLYTLALHRYLGTRDSNYCYRRDFGGVYYLFLRGMNGREEEYGVFYTKPDERLIEALDALF
ncbi:exodeoxyribonuclease V subunit beta [Mesocricetibacter intestinalis]|nr:exodeoxyribonuclease V subunit beta [Mesocricetibacter intestinalis]